MRYTMMQLLVTRRLAEDDIFSRLDPQQTRQQYLAQTFSSDIRFEHYKRPYVYKPFPGLADEQHIIGVIGREHTITVSGPPEEGFAHKPVEDWQTSNVLMDLSKAEQKVAMQPAVGAPVGIFRSLVDRINFVQPTAEWMISVNPITRREEFWIAAERNRGHIAEIDLAFVVPNIWGGSSETEKALKELKDKNNAQEVEVKIKNKDGQLNPQGDRIRESVEYISKGGGTAQLRDENQSILYSSDQEESTVSISIEPDFLVQEADTGMIQSLIRRLFGGT
jgi:hypothetical protein